MDVTSHYQIEDCFFRFWFRFVFKYQYLVELERFDELRALVKRDLAVFCGYSLERYFYWKFVDETSYTRMGGWWDRKGENEIDLVCDDEFGGKLVFHEIRASSERIDRISLGQLSVKDGGYGYHSIWFHLPRFVRKTAKELK